jgi:hypothetical protein
MSDKCFGFLITPDEDGYWVEMHGEYPRSSVLAGEQFYRKAGHFPTVDAALAEYPDAEVIEHSPGAMLSALRGPMSDCPPDWLDPLDAGESW